ncbi:MAG: hypothetical protein WBO34_00135 [Gammaproteobacteria bacterium]
MPFGSDPGCCAKEIIARDKTRLDNLPEPTDRAEDLIENLAAGRQRFREVPLSPVSADAI